jgi:hypothetical protein
MQRVVGLVAVAVALAIACSDDGDVDAGGTGGAENGGTSGSGRGGGQTGGSLQQGGSAQTGGSNVGGADDQAGAGGADGSETLPGDPNPPFAPGTDGFLLLAARTLFYGRARVADDFGSSFYLFEGSVEDELYGTILDPLEGIDDCGVAFPSGEGASGGRPIFLRAESATLIDGDQGLAYESEITGLSMFLDLSAQGVEPRFGETYAFRALGGDLAQPLAIDDLMLPEVLSIETFEALRTLEPRSYDLVWSGSGEEPLFVHIDVRQGEMYAASESHWIDCLLEDDGAFTLPASLFDSMPRDSTAYVRAEREQAFVSEIGGRATLVVGRVTAEHQLAFGEPCDGTDTVTACLEHAAALQALQESCGEELMPVELICPDYLAESCANCPAYFECLTENMSCEDGVVIRRTDGCSC